MGLFKFLRKNRRGNSFENPEIKAEAEKRSAEIRSIRHEIRLAEHEKELARERWNLKKVQDARLFYEEDIRGEDTEENKDDLTALLIPILLKAFMGEKAEGLLNTFNSGNVQQNNPIPLKVSQKAVLSDEEILMQINAIPKGYRRIARKLPDETLKSIIQKHTVFDEETINRAIQLFKENPKI